MAVLKNDYVLPSPYDDESRCVAEGLTSIDAILLELDRRLINHQERAAQYARISPADFNMDPDIAEELLCICRQRQQVCEGNIRESEARKRSQLGRRAELLQRKDRLDRILAELPQRTVGDIKAQLKSIRGVLRPRVTGSVFNGATVSWTFSGIFMTPDVNNYPEITATGDRLRIALPDITVRVRPGNAMTFTGAPRDRRSGMSGPTIHPHACFRGGAPCLGDFAGPICEALSKQDFALAAVCIQAFLEQAVSQDSAGSYWPNWIHPNFLRGIHHDINGIHYRRVRVPGPNQYDTVEQALRFEVDDNGVITTITPQQDAERLGRTA